MRTKPRKRFGQNFLRDPKIIHAIIQAVQPNEVDLIVEIGPGQGAITEPLLELVPNLEVIEIDRDIIELLRIKFKNLTVHAMDVLKFDFETLHAKHRDHQSRKLRIVGNLPYNISTPLLFILLPLSSIIQDMHFMLQKEVVDRIIASPGTKEYGRLSVMVQYFCEPQFLFTVPASAFFPAPKVVSAFIRMKPFSNLPYPAKDFKRFQEITNLAFQQRRKIIANSLKSFLTAEELAKIGINPELRPEMLATKDFVKISNFIFEKR